ncbi:integrase family protein [Ferroglobus placidus DSM 10642]|uniref:Integrase family protein n=1 Tax=Ferroglobus placidus (strain DSM 10642 / AEDII12DO) TaxID=589924 RepID=D3S1R2_FERPA|nr:site-specific integrase [Ferroglobus placidus]ADC64369.1 integrase family protein [Ferroglobus placidus DSM 10642]
MILDYDKMLQRLVDNVRKSSRIKKENKKLFEEFRKYLLVQGCSDAHMYKMLSHLKKILEFVDYDLKKATKSQIEDIVAWINQRKVSDETKRQYKIVLKVLFKWLNGGEYPEAVKWIKTSSKSRKDKLPEKILTEDDVKKLIDAADNPRDKALIALLWETGARISEIYNLKIGDFQDHVYGLQIVIRGKTGARRLPLIESVPYVRAWLNMHPERDNKNAPVWVNVGTKGKGKKVGYRALVKMLNEVAKKAGIDKPVNPHNFRHSRATFLANYFTEAQMCEWFGWVQGSDIPARYVHLSGRDIDAAYARIHGIKDERVPEKSKLTPINCPRCDEKNAPDARFCHRCGQALTLEAALEVEEAESIVLEAFATLKDEDVLKMLEFITKLYRVAKTDPDVARRLKELT